MQVLETKTKEEEKKYKRSVGPAKSRTVSVSAGWSRESSRVAQRPKIKWRACKKARKYNLVSNCPQSVGIGLQQDLKVLRANFPRRKISGEAKM